MNHLKSRRKAAGLSQAQLAEASGVPIRMIRAYEAESPSAHKDINHAEALRVYQLAQALNCSVPDILELP